MQEVKIKVIKYLLVVQKLLQEINEFGDGNTLTDGTNDFKKSIEDLKNQIKTHIVDIGLVDGKDWKDANDILDLNKLYDSFEGDLGTIISNIVLDIQKILSEYISEQEDSKHTNENTETSTKKSYDPMVSTVENPRFKKLEEKRKRLGF